MPGVLHQRPLLGTAGLELGHHRRKAAGELTDLVRPGGGKRLRQLAGGGEFPGGQPQPIERAGRPAGQPPPQRSGGRHHQCADQRRPTSEVTGDRSHLVERSLRHDGSRAGERHGERSNFAGFNAPGAEHPGGGSARTAGVPSALQPCECAVAVGDRVDLETERRRNLAPIRQQRHTHGTQLKPLRRSRSGS